MQMGVPFFKAAASCRSQKIEMVFQTGSLTIDRDQKPSCNRSKKGNLYENHNTIGVNDGDICAPVDKESNNLKTYVLPLMRQGCPKCFDGWGHSA